MDTGNGGGNDVGALADLDETIRKVFEKQSQVLEKSVIENVSKGLQAPMQQTVSLVCKEHFKHIETRLGSLEVGQEHLCQKVGSLTKSFDDLRQTLCSIALDRMCFSKIYII